MAYEEGKRDLAFLQHKFEIEHADVKHEKTSSSTLCEYFNLRWRDWLVFRSVWPLCRCAMAGYLPKGLLAPYKSEVRGPLREELMSWGRDGWEDHCVGG